jgi:hypothetical protein
LAWMIFPIHFTGGPDGSINYNNIQSFSSADYAFILSYSHLFKDDDNSKVQMSWVPTQRSFTAKWQFCECMGFWF